MWYFSPKSYRRKSGGDFSMDYIRNAYGSEKVEKEERNKIAAL